MSQALLTEATSAPRQESKGIWRVRLIEADVHGSSGYYPASVLERDGGSAFPRGTHVYFDHPTMLEDLDRPERSVRDLAGALIENAAYEDGADGKGLFARVQFFPDAKQQVEAISEYVGMSIRAIGVMEESPLSGDVVVQEIVEGLSVDVVTHAGAGGKLVEMTENRASQQQNAIFSLAESDKQGLNNLASLMSTLQETVNGLNTRLTEMENKAKQAQQENNQPAALSAGELVKKLDEADLPQVSRERLARSYQAGADFDAMIAEEKTLVEQVRANTATTDGGGAQQTQSLGGDGRGSNQGPSNSAGTLQESSASEIYKDVFTTMGWA